MKNSAHLTKKKLLLGAMLFNTIRRNIFTRSQECLLMPWPAEQLAFSRILEAIVGLIQFFTGNNATGSCDLQMTDVPGQEVDCPSNGMNDKFRSIKLLDTAPGTTIKVYDHGDAGLDDDWAEIHVLKQVPECIVGTFERDYTDPNGVYRQVFHRKGDGLDGRVSYIKVLATPPLLLDFDALGKLFSDTGWNDKGQLASHFYSQDGHYRIFKPDVSPQLDSNKAVIGTSIYAKIDHIRDDLTDDLCYVNVQIGLDGTVNTRVDIDWAYAGSDASGSFLAECAKFVVREKIDLSLFWKDSNIIGMFSGLFGQIVRSSLGVVDPVGRMNLLAVANHAANKIVQATRAA